MSSSSATADRRHDHDRGLARDATVAALMSREFAVVPTTMNVGELTHYLLERQLMSVLVADEHERVRGFVSMIDLVRERYLNGETENDTKPNALELLKHDFRGESPSTRRGFHVDESTNREAHARATVGSIMMPFVLALFDDAPINEAAALMAAENVQQVVILARSGRRHAVGIVTALDILRWWALKEGVMHESGLAHWRASCEYSVL
jgi:predicted transcriptional regulator